MITILVAGAYSPGNIGDGLLAELSVQFSNEALQCTIYLSAVDSKGFKSEILNNPDRYPGLNSINVFSSLNVFRLAKLFLRRNLVVLAIGGEYLNFSGFKSACKSLIANGLAIFLALATNRPTGFLPQGIILSQKMQKLILPFFRKAKWILLRDSKSIEELSKLRNISKSFDLAIVDIKPTGNPHPPSSVIGSILHEVSRSTEYISAIRQIATTENMKFYIQSSYGGNNQDSLFLENTLKISKYESAKNLYGNNSDIGVLISTRLHGAVGAIRSGIPAIHIAYSRKGRAVFNDLGISEYCVGFEDLDPVALLHLAHNLNTSSEARKAYWDKIALTSPSRQIEKIHILELIRSLSKWVDVKTDT
jgi:polysaccharide pyruvyl transferase WcaK-like protein